MRNARERASDAAGIHENGFVNKHWHTIHSLCNDYSAKMLIELPSYRSYPLLRRARKAARMRSISSGSGAMKCIG